MPFKSSPFIASILFISLCLCACGNRDDAAAIRKLIARASQMAEEHRIADLMQLTADGFSASPGSHDAGSVRRILFIAFKHYGMFQIRYPRPTVEVEADAATARTVIHFMIVSQDRPMPELKELYENPQQWVEQASEKADLYQLKLALIKDEGDWRVKNAELTPFKGLSF